MQLCKQRLIVGGIAFSIVTLALCAWQAWKIESWFRHLELQDFRRPGPQPRTPNGLDKRIGAATKFRWEQLGKTSIRLIVLILCIVIIPTALLFVAAGKYQVIAPQHYGFIVHGTRSNALTDAQLNSFVVSQFIRGTLLDAIEIFNIDLAAVDYQRADLPITLIVFVYRLFVELFAAGFFLALARFVLLLMKETPGLRDLKWRRSLGGQIGRT